MSMTETLLAIRQTAEAELGTLASAENKKKCA